MANKRGWDILGPESEPTCESVERISTRHGSGETSKPCSAGQDAVAVHCRWSVLSYSDWCVDAVY